ncbi:S41 family peptidase [Dongia deserti]|uniref:S41 family peptidase n=1 Tax=Dongia deserti TaxID=2268030 RepID=UPI0013C4A0FF|nr:S41 family peptidase [Dongia deserti]
MTPHRITLIALLLIGLAAPVRAEVEPHRKPDIAVFDEVWRLVDRHFYDPAFRGQDWDALRGRYRPLAAAAPNADAQAEIIDEMLAKLAASHTARYRQDDPAYYQLVDIFSGSLRRELRSLFPNGVRYPGIGLFTRRIGDKLFVSGMIAGLPAEEAGILVGDEIIDADGKPFEPVESFDGKVGRSVTMRVRRTSGGPVVPITMRPQWIEPDKAFLDAMTDGARIIESGGRKIGYVRIWSYAGERYQGRLEQLLSTGKLADADALIWDLRDGWGGAQPYYLDIFSKLGPTMTLTDRDGDQDMVNVKWRKPVALLINGGSRSGKEVLAYGFKKYGVGEVIGTRTAGALLAGRAFLLPDDSLLLLAVSDVAVDGERLERVGVSPTIEVPFPLAYAAGKDPQVDKAVEVLTRQIGG